MGVREELDALKFRLKLKTDEELATMLNTTKVSIDKWVSRKKIPEKWKRIINLQFGDTSISNNQNSVIIGGDNSGNIINSSVPVSSEFMEVVELYNKYGNTELANRFKEQLLKIKEVMGD